MSDRSGRERRRHTRVPWREDVVEDGTKMCTTTDISEGGLFISALETYEADSLVEVTIPLKGEKVTVKAQVKYCQPGIGMGIMFVELSTDQKAKIREFVQDMGGQSEQDRRTGTDRRKSEGPRYTGPERRRGRDRRRS